MHQGFSGNTGAANSEKGYKLPSQGTISSQYYKTTYISQRTINILTWIKWEGRGMVVG